MARPKKEITADNVDFLRAYLNRVLSDLDRKDIIKVGNRLTALAQLNAETEDRVAATQQWLDTWISEKAKIRMWGAWRQNKYKIRHKVRMVAVSDETYQELSEYAEQHELSFSKAIKKLLAEKQKRN